MVFMIGILRMPGICTGKREGSIFMGIFSLFFRLVPLGAYNDDK